MHRVTFLRSISAAVKRALLARCTALLYTPDREHFGIVPVEAAHARRPVIAVDSGGPRETVVNGVTGWLCSPGEGEEERFAEAMGRFLDDRELVGRMGEAARKRVDEMFSFAAFTEKLDVIIRELVE